MKKKYILRKFVLADSLEDAIRLGKNAKIDEAYLDPTYVEEQPRRKMDEIGFNY